MEKVNVLIAIASGRDPKWPFPISLANLVAFTLRAPLPVGSEIHVEAVRNFDTAQSRRKLVAIARELKATHINFLDDDMDFPCDAITRMLTREKEIIAANYTCRGFPVVPLALKDGKRVFSRNKTGIEQVDWAPTGLMLIDMRVFDKIERPYFDAPPETPQSDNGISDDVYFCRKARAAGVEVWLDHDVSLQTFHVGDVAFSHGSTQPHPDKDLIEMCREVLR